MSIFHRLDIRRFALTKLPKYFFPSKGGINRSRKFNRITEGGTMSGHVADVRKKQHGLRGSMQENQYRAIAFLIHGASLFLPSNGPVKLPGPQTRGYVDPRKTAAPVNFNRWFAGARAGRLKRAHLG